MTTINYEKKGDIYECLLLHLQSIGVYTYKNKLKMNLS